MDRSIPLWLVSSPHDLEELGKPGGAVLARASLSLPPAYAVRLDWGLWGGRRKQAVLAANWRSNPGLGDEYVLVLEDSPSAFYRGNRRVRRGFYARVRDIEDVFRHVPLRKVGFPMRVRALLQVEGERPREVEAIVEKFDSRLVFTTEAGATGTQRDWLFLGERTFQGSRTPDGARYRIQLPEDEAQRILISLDADDEGWTGP